MRRASRRSPERRGPIVARSHLPSWSGIPCFPPRRPSGRRGASPPTLRYRFRVEGYGSSSRVTSGPVIWSRASSRDLLGANQRVSCRLRRDSRSSRESGVSTLDAFVLRRGKRPARIEYASSTPHPRLPLPSLRQLLVQIFSLPPISFSFMTVCPYDPFPGGGNLRAERSLDAAANSIGRGTGRQKARGLAGSRRLCRCSFGTRRAGGREKAVSGWGGARRSAARGAPCRGRASGGVTSTSPVFSRGRTSVVPAVSRLRGSRRRARVPAPPTRAESDARHPEPRRGAARVRRVSAVQRARQAVRHHRQGCRGYELARATPYEPDATPAPAATPSARPPGPPCTEWTRRTSPPDYAPSLPRPHPLPLTRLPSLAPPRPQPNKPPMTSSVVSPPP